MNQLARCLFSLAVALVLAGCGGSGPAPQSDKEIQLIAQLRGGSPDDRHRAAEELTRMKSRAAVPSLLAALSDSQLAVRIAAVVALGEIGDKQAVPVLITALDDGNPQIRKVTADALGALGDAAALDPLLGKLNDDAATVRYAVAVALGKLGPPAFGALTRALQGGQPAVRAGAVYALGVMRIPAATDAILAVLNDPNLSVRRNAVDALGRARDDRAVPTLTKLLAEPLTDADRQRYRAQYDQSVPEKVMREISVVLRERQAAGVVPAGGSYPHQADKRRKVLDDERARVADLVAPPLTDAKRAEILLVVSDRLGKEAYAQLTRDQRDIALAKELMFLNDLAKPPGGDEKDQQLGQILARRTAREWWDGLGPKGQENAVRGELRRRFEEELRHEEIELRQNAARALAAIASPASVQALLTALNDGSRAASDDADGALQELGAGVIAPLGQVVLTATASASIRSKAMELLAARAQGRNRQPLPATETAALSAALLPILKDGEPAYRLTAAEILSRLGTNNPQVLGPLLAAMKSDDPRLRRIAARSLGQLGDPQAGNVLTAALGDQDAGVRAAAAEAVGTLGATQAIAPLVALLRTALNDPSADDLTITIVRSLGQLKAKAAVDLMIPLLQKTGRDDRDVAGATARALGRIGDPRATEPLIALMRSHSWGPCFEATKALGDLGDPAAIEALVERTDTRPFPEMPEWTLESLGKIKDARAVTALLKVLKAGNPLFIKFAAEALVAQGVTAVPALVEALADENKEYRGAAAQVLGQIGAPAVEPLIQFVAKPPSTGALSGAIYSLSSIRDERTVAPLLGLLQHADAGIRANAAWALGFSSGQQVQDALQAVVDKDPEPKVRAAARGALDRVQTTVTTPAAK